MLSYDTKTTLLEDWGEFFLMIKNLEPQDKRGYNGNMLVKTVLKSVPAGIVLTGVGWALMRISPSFQALPIVILVFAGYTAFFYSRPGKTVLPLGRRFKRKSKTLPFHKAGMPSLPLFSRAALGAALALTALSWVT